jgi:hypothetical protein
MAKFRIRLKVQALELEIDGERQDLPLIASAVNRQFSTLVEPAEIVAEVPKLPSGNGNGSTSTEDGKGKVRKPRPPSNRTPAEFAAPVEYRHDPATFGVPSQEWSILEKVIWMLWVLQHTGTKEYVTGQIVATFNHHFKAAGKLHPPLVPRELQRAKIEVPTPVGEDKDRWYLTAEGERQAKALVAKALGQG